MIVFDILFAISTNRYVTWEILLVVVVSLVVVVVVVVNWRDTGHERFGMSEYVFVEEILVVEFSIANVALEIDRSQVDAHVSFELRPVRERTATVLTRERMMLCRRRQRR